MTHTAYQTVDGLPPRPTHDADITTARDLARVAYQIIHTTDLLKWSSQEQCSLRRRRMHAAYDQSSDRAFRRMRRAQDRIHFSGRFQPHGDRQARQPALHFGDPRRALESTSASPIGEAAGLGLRAFSVGFGAAWRRAAAGPCAGRTDRNHPADLRRAT